MDLPENNKNTPHFNSQGLIVDKQTFSFDLISSVIDKFLEDLKGKDIVLATDMRSLSKEIVPIIYSLTKKKDVHISTLGITSIEHFLFCIVNNKNAGGIMISSNGFDSGSTCIRFFDQNSVNIPSEKLFVQVTKNFDQNKINSENIKTPKISALKDYFFNTLKNIDPLIWKDHCIVIDGGNGIGSEFLISALNKIPQLETIDLYSQPDELFPHHFPDVYDRNNTSEIALKIIEVNADFGVFFDHDGDQILFLDEKGQVVEPAFIGALLTKIILEKDPNAKIGYTPEFKWAILSEIKNNTGIALNNDMNEIFKLSKELDIDFTATSDGTYLYKDSNYLLNSLLTIGLIIEYLSRNNKSLSDAVLEYRSKIFCKQIYFSIKQGVNLRNLQVDLVDILENPNFDEKFGISYDDPNYHIFADIDKDLDLFCFYIESSSELLNNDIISKLTNKLSSEFKLIPNKSSLQILKIIPDISLTPREKFEKLLNNFWFTWNPHYIMPIIELYADGWRKNVPPEALIANYGQERLLQLLNDKDWELSQNLRLFEQYEKSTSSFDLLSKINSSFKILKNNPIVYFCMEFGFVDWLQIYSGGLGILAADYIKQASDMGVPVIGIGIFYHQGYLHQDFGPDGTQLENYIHQDPLDYNMELAKDKNGNIIVIELPMGDSIVNVRAWKQVVGKSIMYLLDTNFEDNKAWEDRLISGYLYGGDIENRIRQEIMLGIGGERLLQQLEIQPSIYHMNEGHSGFLIIERVKEIMNKQKIEFDPALKIAKENLVFTNHTLKQAGNDIFDFMLFEKYLSNYTKELNVPIDKVFNLGDDRTYSQGGFSMTVFCLRNATISNAVSKLHGKAAMSLWKDYPLVPITNGVHLPTWISPEIHKLLDEYVGENWHNSMDKLDPDSVQKIPSKKLWDAHIIRKKKLIHSLNNELGLNLRDDVLTISWSRRLAAYKRPDLIIADIERLKMIISDTQKPVQILIAGKSHPKDTIGKHILQKINQNFNDDFFKNKIEVIPGYNWQLARRMVSGSDIWLNTPYRYEEACGTSGMKAAANGVIQFTTMDGWTDEVNWYKIGWVISEADSSDSLYDILENQIVPLFYNRNYQGFNEDWIDMMRNSIELILKDFSSETMLKNYLTNVYSKLLP